MTEPQSQNSQASHIACSLLFGFLNIDSLMHGFFLFGMGWDEDVFSSNQIILEGMLVLPPATMRPQPSPHSSQRGDDAVKGSV
jgi:hypothetical protein